MSSTDPYRPRPEGEQYGQQPGFGQPVPYEQVQPYGQPAPQPYGQQPGYGQGYAAAGYQPYAPYVRQPELAHWGLRVGARLVDGLLVNVLPYAIFAVGTVIGMDQYGPSSGELNGTGVAFAVLSLLLWGSLWIWNIGVRQGRTGRTLGKSAARTRLVDATTGQPVGTGRALLRDVAHILDMLVFYLGFLWPLWDAQRQTFADKVVGTVVVRD